MVLFADTETRMIGAGRMVYGFTLLERHLRVFGSLGARRITIVGPPGKGGCDSPFDGFDDRWYRNVHPVTFVGADESPDRWLPADKGESVLVLNADHLYDNRVLSALVEGETNRKVIDSESRECCRLLVANTCLLNHLTESWYDSDALWSKLDVTSETLCSKFDIREMNPYVVNLRRSLSAWWLILDSDQKVVQAEALLIDASQKGTLDFPAEFIHPPLENRATKWVSASTVTPNQVTTLTVLLAFLGAGLMVSGYLVTGLIIGFIVGILDGVDGKLARVTVRCTEFGDRYEHILDVIYELTWYWAIGWMLSNSGAEAVHYVSSAVITLFYLLDKAATGMFKSKRGKELFDYAPIDRIFRRIGARRNTNVLLLLIGTAIGMAGETFILVTIWTVVTAGFHWTRAIWLLSKSRSVG